MLFTFPSRYWFTIGHQGYLALEGGPPGFPQGFTCPVVLKNMSGSRPSFAYGAVTLSGDPFQESLARWTVCNFPGALKLSRDMSYNPPGA